MRKNITNAVFLLLMIAGLAGCIPLLAGTAGGAGTAVWLSGKLVQVVDAPFDNTIKAAEKALDSLHLTILKEVKKEDVTQLRSRYTNDQSMWIDIRRITEHSTRVEIRVGVISPDKEASNDILKRIQENL